MEEEKRLDRRTFLSIGTAAIAAVISAGMAIPAVAYVIGPALKKNAAEEWIRLGSASKVELGVPTLFKAKIERQAGWIVDERELSIYVLTDDGREFVALSNICPHLGCRVRWIADEQEFFCPCHNAAFAKDGRVLDGPPPRPLDHYEIKVEDDQLFVLGV
ncbi:MAG TPA: ubiquinol-cytochrome c reductase iron-sulfur subunit [candidate division Zixibacteria bacterium]|jgi:menaquinol-cytochrome c reductase iron-sulfur subunit|nr:ubiquinol-cytochrome c reductase iron-sulfur subunit [candidate division Zixibacteria bacterium]